MKLGEIGWKCMKVDESVRNQFSFWAWVEVFLDEDFEYGIFSDIHIYKGRKSNKSTVLQNLRQIKFIDHQTEKELVFLTNNFVKSAKEIAQLYQRRWQIELMFKRFKSAYQLRYFLGNNPNAIKIQIWCSLIADLLIKVIKDRLKGCRHDEA